MASASPPDDEHAPTGEEDELELTSIMDAEQRRALQKATRAAAEAQALKEADPKAGERETARPPPEALAAVEGEVSIPKPPSVPSVSPVSREQPVAKPAAVEKKEEPPAPPAKKAAAAASTATAKAAVKAPAPAPASSSSSTSYTLALVAFVLLAAAIAFALR
jgi:hypothetical protein